MFKKVILLFMISTKISCIIVLKVHKTKRFIYDCLKQKYLKVNESSLFNIILTMLPVNVCPNAQILNHTFDSSISSAKKPFFLFLTAFPLLALSLVPCNSESEN